MINTKNTLEKMKLPISKIGAGFSIVSLIMIYTGWVLYAIQSRNTEAKVQAELSAVIANGSKKIPKYGTSGNYLTVPRFKEYDK